MSEITDVDAAPEQRLKHGKTKTMCIWAGVTERKGRRTPHRKNERGEKKGAPVPSEKSGGEKEMLAKE